MKFINQIFAAYPTLSTMYIVVWVGYWFFCVFRLHRYIQLSGLNYASGLYAHMTAAQQRVEYNKHKLKGWLKGTLVISIMAAVWPIPIGILLMKPIKTHRNRD